MGIDNFPECDQKVGSVWKSKGCWCYLGFFFFFFFFCESPPDLKHLQQIVIVKCLTTLTLSQETFLVLEENAI
jgi:hypothetical protein